MIATKIIIIIKKKQVNTKNENKPKNKQTT